MPLGQDVPHAVDTLIIEEGPPVVHHHPDYEGSDAGREYCKNQQPGDVAGSYYGHEVRDNY